MPTDAERFKIPHTEKEMGRLDLGEMTSSGGRILTDRFRDQRVRVRVRTSFAARRAPLESYDCIRARIVVVGLSPAAHFGARRVSACSLARDLAVDGGGVGGKPRVR